MRSEIDTLALAQGQSFKSKDPEGELAEMNLTVLFTSGDHRHHNGDSNLAVLTFDHTIIDTSKAGIALVGVFLNRLVSDSTHLC